MKSSFLIVVCLTSLAYAEQPPVVSTTGVTLWQCYEKAQRISETLGISEENIRIIEAQYKDSLGSVLPHVSFIKEQFFQENIQPGGGSNVQGSFLKSTQPQSYIQLQQPLFSGFRDWAAISGAKSLERQSQYNAAQTNEQLLADVASAFYAALTIDEQLAVLTQTRQLTSNRVQQLTHWVDIGRSRQAEVLSAQTQLATEEAQIQDEKRSQAEARDLLYFLTGITIDTALVDAATPAMPTTLDEALQRAQKRPDLMANIEALKQAGYNVRYAKGGYSPTLSLVADYYIERFGFEQDVRWDATFLLTVPIFAGGSTKAEVNEARAQEKVAQLTLNRMTRDIDRQVRTAFDDVRYADAEATVYDNAVSLSDRNYQVQEKEYRLGLITNIEVLQTLSTTQDTKSQWLQTKYAARLDHIRMQIAMGEGLPQ